MENNIALSHAPPPNIIIGTHLVIPLVRLLLSPVPHLMALKPALSLARLLNITTMMELANLPVIPLW